MNADVPLELKQSLRVSERMPAFLSKLEREMAIMPRKFQTREQVVFCVRELTLFFLNNVKTKADQMMMSDAAKMAIVDKQEKANVLDKAATTGIIDEEVMSVLEEE